MWLLTLVFALQPQGGCVALSLSLPKARILVGEPTQAVVTSRAFCDIDAPRGTVGLQLDDGSGYRKFFDADEQMDSEALRIEGKRRLKAGSAERSSHRLVLSDRRWDAHGRLDSQLQFPFAKAGTHRVQAYWDDVRSNVVSVTVVQPEGEDARVFEELRKDPEWLTLVGVMDRPGEARDFADRHAGSPYVAPVRLALWRMQIWDALQEDHSSGPSTRYRRTAAVLSTIESVKPGGTAFDVDRLVLVAENLNLIRDQTGVRRVWERIAREHPDTPAADKARAVASGRVVTIR